MDTTDIKMLNMHGMHKSAIIYRNDSASYVYVCFHCGNIFNDFNDTLQHIESHFQVANVLVDQFAVEEKEPKLAESWRVPLATETVDIKIEVLENNDFDDNTMSIQSESMCDDQQDFRCKVCNSIYATKFLIRIHTLSAHMQEKSMKCRQCTKTFTNHLDFGDHLKLHMSRNEVTWKSASDGIATPIDFSWSTYEESATNANVLAPMDDVFREDNPKRRSSNEPSNVKAKRKKRAPRVYTRPYKCHKCPQTWRFINELRNHLKTHTADEMLQIFKCKECDCYYKNDFELRFHILVDHHMVNKIKCKACSAEFDVLQSKQFEEHLHMHKGTDHKRWMNISEGISDEGKDCSMYEEIDSFNEPKHPCEFCTQRFYIKCNLDVHMKSVHSGQRRLQCGQCDSVFTTPKYYFAHQLEHQRVGPTIIEHDDNVLLANLDACIDERIVHDEDEYERLYRCLICNSTFDIHYDVRSHIRERHVYKMFPPPKEPKREFICDLCGMRLKTKAAVKNHLLIHTNTKSHACTICGKKFRQNSDRRIHERQHTGEKPFQCHECGKRFISKGLLTAHKKSHDDSTYPCPICGRVFNLPSGYRKHIQTHRQDRAFKCTVCTKSFNTRIYLTKHMSIHSDKQYQCRFCELKFSTSDGQRQHQRYKHHYRPS